MINIPRYYLHLQINDPTIFVTFYWRFQQEDKSLIEIAKEKPKDYSIQQFHDAGKTYSLIYRNGKTMILK